MKVKARLQEAIATSLSVKFCQCAGLQNLQVQVEKTQGHILAYIHIWRGCLEQVRGLRAWVLKLV